MQYSSDKILEVFSWKNAWRMKVFTIIFLQPNITVHKL